MHDKTEIGEQIIRRLIEGESLRQICRDEGMPNRVTVHRWMSDDVDFATKCARARTIQADLLLDEMADIEADTLAGSVNPAAARTVLSSKQWRAAKLAPKKYGDRLALAGDDESPVAVSLADAIKAARERAGRDRP